MGKSLPERSEATNKDEAVHVYIADMALQLSHLAAQVGDEILSRHLSQAASVARDPAGDSQART